MIFKKCSLTFVLCNIADVMLRCYLCYTETILCNINVIKYNVNEIIFFHKENMDFKMEDKFAKVVLPVFFLQITTLFSK